MWYNIWKSENMSFWTCFRYFRTATSPCGDVGRRLQPPNGDVGRGHFTKGWSSHKSMIIWKDEHDRLRTFCLPWAADSEYVVHYLIPWTSCRISRLKVKSKAKMALFETKIVRDEEHHWCWCSFCSSWDADSEYVGGFRILRPSCRISRLKGESKAKMAPFVT